MSIDFEKKCKKVMKYRFSDPQRAYDICCEILENGLKTEDSYQIAYARLYMGDTLFTLGKFKEAIDNMMIAEKIQKKNGYENLLEKNYNITGIIYVNQGDGLLGLDYYFKALKLARKCKDAVMQGMIYNNIGVLLHRVGDYGDAAYYCSKGYEISQKQGKKEQKKMYNKKQYFVNLAIGCQGEKKYDQARKYLELAEAEYDSEPSTYFSAVEINRLVDSVSVYAETGEREKAIEEANKILSLSGECYEEVEAFNHFICLIHELLSLEYYVGAEHILTELQRVYGKSEVVKRSFRLCESWIEYYKATGEKEKLKKYYQQYYELKKKSQKEENTLIVRAIDNRYKLEYERMTNEQLSANTRKLMNTSEIDELTGISNRYGLKKRFTKLCEIACFQKARICLCLFDIDEFKIYNDEYGHLKGDDCLKRISGILQDIAGTEYFASRYGGDEFVILGIDKSDEELQKFVEKLFREISRAKMPFLRHQEADTVTISMGVVNKVVEKDYSLTDFIHSADKNLYKAKNGGKNQYVLE